MNLNKKPPFFIVFLLGLLLIVIVVVGFFLFGQAKKTPGDELPPENGEINLIEEFCGFSTYSACLVDEDCRIGGCSGQVCQARDEESAITTCEYRTCYNADRYQMSCLCFAGQCQWRETAND
jgi:eight-cysteine-cluster-containing protein